MFAQGFERAPSARRMVIGVNRFPIGHLDYLPTVPLTFISDSAPKTSFENGARFFQIAHIPRHRAPAGLDARSCVSKTVIAFFGREAETSA